MCVGRGVDLFRDPSVVGGDGLHSVDGGAECESPAAVFFRSVDGAGARPVVDGAIESCNAMVDGFLYAGPMHALAVRVADLRKYLKMRRQLRLHGRKLRTGHGDVRKRER